MIIDAIIEFFFNPLFEWISGLPDFAFELPEWAYSNVSGFAQGLGYVIPIPVVAFILITKVNCHIFKIGMALVVRIKSLIPFWGS